MVGNDDYQELLRVAATRKCNVILAGDERQLSSVGRGGMFEGLAEKHGSSTVLDIKRQSSNWGKEVASCFADSRVLEAQHKKERDGHIRDHIKVILLVNEGWMQIQIAQVLRIPRVHNHSKDFYG